MRGFLSNCLGFFVSKGCEIVIIEKVLNNNVLQTLDDKGAQFVVMGRGLGFQKKVGESVDSEKIEKTFVLKSSDNHFSAIYNELLPEEINSVYKIIQLAEDELNINYHENLIVTLADHIHFAIERTKKNQALKNPLAWQVKRLYKNEYRVGLKALTIIEEELNIQLDSVEASSIALHLINAQKEGHRVEETLSTVRITEDIIRIVELHFGKAFDEDSLSFGRFVTHLQYFAERINQKQLYKGKDDTFLYEQVKQSYPRAHACAEKIKHFVETQLDYPVGREEQVYLTIHIQRLTQ